MAYPSYLNAEIILTNQDQIAVTNDGNDHGVTGSDSNLGPYTAGNWKALWINQGSNSGETGAVHVLLKGGGTGSVFEGVSRGTLLPLQVIRVYHTGTTVVNGSIIGLN